MLLIVLLFTILCVVCVSSYLDVNLRFGSLLLCYWLLVPFLMFEFCFLLGVVYLYLL